MVVIVYDDTADLTEKSLSDTNHMSYIRQDLATDEETQESNVRATIRGCSQGSAATDRAGMPNDAEGDNPAPILSASGAVTS